ncbi:MAG: ATP-grasp domain-containing protein [Desulfobacteraceae bacterium]|nr:ATP-grasp domain-containing protein [Desulfobacteraceae bacterium]
MDMKNRKTVVFVDPLGRLAMNFYEILQKLDINIVNVVTVSDEIFKLHEHDLPENFFSTISNSDVIFESNAKIIQGYLNKMDLNIVGFLPITEPGVEAADELSSLFGLPCNHPDLILARRDKSEMKKAVKAAGIHCPDFKKCYSVADIDAFLAKNTFPVIVKPAKATASMNVFKCEDRKSVIDAFNVIKGSKDFVGNTVEFALLEEFMDGIEYIVDLFFNNDNPIVTDIWEYEKIQNQYADLLYYHAIQHSPDNPVFQTLIEYAIDVAKAIGMRVGPAHVEIKKDPQKGFNLIEIGARLPGARIPDVMREISDFDPYASMVNLLINQDSGLKDSVKLTKKCIIALFPNEKQGVIKEVKGLDEIKSLSSFFALHLKCQVGDNIAPTTDLVSNPFIAWFVNQDPKVLKQDVDKARSLFSIKVL